MANFPNWKDLKKSAQDVRENKFTPERQEELRDKAQKSIDVGREQLSKRLKGPAAHLRNVGSQFKSGLKDDENTASGPAAAGDPDAGSATESAPPSA